MKQMLCKLKYAVKRHTVFLRILVFYLAGSIVLLVIFSSVLTWYLTKRAMEDVMSSSQDTINQMYNTTNYILNDAYDSYFQLYQTTEMNTAMFSGKQDVEDELTISQLFQRMRTFSSCVDSIYIINRTLDKVYTDQGTVSTLKEFYDQQALRLFNLYNENSSVIFLPRTTAFPLNGKTAKHNFVTMIFARMDSSDTASGGLIVNIDQSRLHSLITADLSNKGNMYIVTNTGSIVSNSDPSQINTTLQGTKVWEHITTDGAQKDLVFTEVYRGQKSIVTCKKADRLLFYFLSIIPSSEMDAKVAYIRNFTMSILMVLMFFSFLIAMVCSRRIYSPISKLVLNLRGRRKNITAPEPAMNEFAFLNSAYTDLCHEVESLNSENHSFARAQIRETLIRLLHGEFQSEEKCKKQLKKYGLTFQNNKFLVAVLGFDNFADMIKQHSAQDISLYKYAIINVSTELFADKNCSVLSTENGQDYVTLILNPSGTSPEDFTWIRSVLQQVGTVMKRHLNFSISTGIGTPVKSLVWLSQSYNNALTAMSYRAVLGQNTVIAYPEIAARQNLMPEYPVQTEAELIQAIRSRNYRKASEKLNEFFTKISIANMDYINMSLSQLIISLNRILKQLAVGKKIENTLNYRSLSVQLRDCDCLDKKKERIEEFCKEIINVRNNEIQSKKNDLIERTCEFIQANYANPMLDVENIAEYAEISASYLRTIFKNVTGKTPNEYITGYRIKKAKELLETTDYTTKDIAAAVGYLNHRYFYSVFKAKVGQTPTDYRNDVPETMKRGPLK